LPVAGLLVINMFEEKWMPKSIKKEDKGSRQISAHDEDKPA